MLAVVQPLFFAAREHPTLKRGWSSRIIACPKMSASPLHPPLSFSSPPPPFLPSSKTLSRAPYSGCGIKWSHINRTTLSAHRNANAHCFMPCYPTVFMKRCVTTVRRAGNDPSLRIGEFRWISVTNERNCLGYTTASYVTLFPVFYHVLPVSKFQMNRAGDARYSRTSTY